MEPHSWITNKKKMSFPSLCRIHRSIADLPWRVAELLSPTEKGKHVIRLRWSQRGIRGWPSAILSLENSLSVGFTGHCSLSSWQQRGGGHCAGWMVCCPLSSTSFPSPSPPLVPCPLSYHRDPASWEQLFMQSSNFSKLFAFPSQPPYTNCSQRPVWAL